MDPYVMRVFVMNTHFHQTSVRPDTYASTHGGALDSNNFDLLDVGFSFLVPLNEEICDWDQNAVENSGSRNCLNSDLHLL